MSAPCRIATAVGLALLVAPAGAQWRVVVLNPAGVQASQILANNSSFQAGRIVAPDGRYHPARWNGTLQSYTDLLPTGWISGIVNGMDGPTWVGYLEKPGRVSAILWLNNGQAFVDLSPGPSYVIPMAYDVSGNQQVGAAYFSSTGLPHALVWHGSAATVVDLHPPVCSWSEAFATDGTYQGGWAEIPSAGSQIHAALWAGSAASFIDMNPAGSIESVIEGMAPGVQVGWGLFAGIEHAIIWRGSPQSAVHVNPPGSLSSRLLDTNGTIHAGFVSFTGWAEACIWLGDTPADCKNLHSFLGPGWYSSAAFSVAVKDGWVYVGGSAAKPNTNAKAVIWIGRAPETMNPKPKPILDKAPPG